MKETQQSVSSGRLMPSAEDTTKTIDLLVQQLSSSKVDQGTINEVIDQLEASPAFGIPWSVGGHEVERQEPTNSIQDA